MSGVALEAGCGRCGQAFSAGSTSETSSSRVVSLGNPPQSEFGKSWSAEAGTTVLGKSEN